MTLDARVMRTYIHVIAGVQIVLLAQVLVLVQYFELDPVASLSYFAADEHCLAPNGQGLGVHCFGDYSYVRNAIASGNPWAAPFSLNYSAVALSPVFAGYLVEMIFGNFNAGLFLYLTLLLLSVSSVWLIVVLPNRTLGISDKILGVLAVGPASLPALIVLDRGNTVGFILPALLLAVSGLRTNNQVKLVAGIVLASLVKPQFILLVGLLIAMRRVTLALVAGAIGAAFQLVAYLPFGAGAVPKLLETGSNILRYGSGVSLEDLYPNNVSLANSLHFFLGSPVGLAEDDSVLASLLFFVLVAATVTVFAKAVSTPMLAALFLSIAALGVPVTFGYYLIIAPLTIVLGSMSDLSSSVQSTSSFIGASATPGKQVVLVLLAVANVSSSSALLLPIASGDRGTLVTTLELAGAPWLIFLAGVLVHAVVASRPTPTQIE